MTDQQRAAMQAALEALINGKNVRAGEGGTKHQPTMEDVAIEQLRAALAEQDAEPVAWWVPGAGPYAITATAQSALEPPWEPLYAAPPRREWAGLTDEEIAEMSRQEPMLLFCDGLEELIDIARDIEAALRAKNGGGNA